MNEEKWLTCVEPDVLLAWIEWQDKEVYRRCSRFLVDMGEIEHCNAIRCIAGNPFNQVLSPEEYGAILKRDAGRPSYGPKWFPHRPLNYDTRDSILSWRDGAIPKTVQAIIQGEVCRSCGGRGFVPYNNPYLLPNREDYTPCVNCNRIGRVNTHDPISMSILADMLSEAGYNEELVSNHLRGTEPCACKRNYRTLQMLKWPIPVPFHELSDTVPLISYVCALCDGTGYAPHVHYDGCWALELFNIRPQLPAVPPPEANDEN